tara:strand:- start:432 stop:674 length:243 start_codon:yes stop_codon:yes gene_type:complete
MPSDDIDDMKRELEHLRTENEALKQKKSSQITFKVAPKGGMSLYGLSRFPVTLYKNQWISLLDVADKITEFLINHDDQLK